MVERMTDLEMIADLNTRGVALQEEVNLLHAAIRRLNCGEELDNEPVVYHADDCALEVWLGSGGGCMSGGEAPPLCDCDRAELEALVNNLRGD